MSEDAEVRRRRDCCRRIMAELKRRKWNRPERIYGVFDVGAEKPGGSRIRIRICFNIPDKGDIVSVGLEPSSYRTYKEIWYIGPTGKVELEIPVRGTLPDPLK